jgi:flagellar basal body-associated protein FliL
MAMPINEQLPAKAKAQEPTNISTIMIVVALVLIAVGVAYSQGWFSSSSTNADMEGITVSESQTMDHEKIKEDAVNVSQKPGEPDQSATK